MLYDQFSKPEGLLGKLAGWFMAKENDELNEWTLSFLDIREKERVLEIGFGPGSALKKVINDRSVEIVGIDPSEAMVETALRRIQRSGKTNQVCLIQGEASQLIDFHQQLDKIYSINNITFWDAPEETLTHLRSLLSTGGRIALTLCPHEDGATNDTTEVLGGQLRSLLVHAGYKNIETFIKPTKPNDTVCVVGSN